MSTQLPFNYNRLLMDRNYGRQLARDAAARAKRGIANASDHAGESWKHEAFTFLLAYAKTHEVFCGEDVSDAHIAAGLAQPPDLRAWSQCYRQAVKDCVIQHYDNNGWSRRRCSPARRYRSRVAQGAP